MSETAYSPTPNGKSKFGVEAWPNRELGVMLKLIGELKVCHFVFGHNSHTKSVRHHAIKGDQVTCWTCPTGLRLPMRPWPTQAEMEWCE
jgi:hypothetical protein